MGEKDSRAVNQVTKLWRKVPEKEGGAWREKGVGQGHYVMCVLDGLHSSALFLSCNSFLYFFSLPGPGQGARVPELPPDRDGLHGVLPGHLPAVREAPAQMKENITFKR